MRLVLTNPHSDKSIVVSDWEGTRTVGPDGQTPIHIPKGVASTTVTITEEGVAGAAAEPQAAGQPETEGAAASGAAA